MPKPKARAAHEQRIRLGWRRALLLALVVAGLFAAYLSTELKQNHEPGFPLDDSWIHLTFARNLARGWGFAYNQGEPVAGSTAPLWTFMLAVIHLITRNVSAVVVLDKLLGAAFLLASAVFAFRIADRLTGSGWVGLAAGLAVATLGPMGWAMMSGMEVTLSAALTLAGIYYYLKFRTGWMSMLGWALFGLAAWARPESILLAAFAAFDSLLRRFVLKQRPVFWRGFGIWIAIVLAWLALNYSLSGSPFPQTYLVKAGATSLLNAIAIGSFQQVEQLLTVAGPVYFVDFCAHVWRANPVLCLLVPIGLAGLTASAVRSGRHDGIMVPLVVLGYVPLIGFISPSFSAAFQNGRYIGNVTALAAVVAIIGIAYVWQALRNARLRWGVTAGLSVLVVFNAVTVSVATARNTAHAESCINQMQVALGQWLAENTPLGATVACNDIGAIGYFSGRHIFDLFGLVTKEMRGREPDLEGFMSFFKQSKPDYLAIIPAAFPDLRDAQFLQPVAEADVPDNTASLLDFRPQSRTFAAILILDLVVKPVPVTTVVYKCNWALLPPPWAGAE